MHRLALFHRNPTADPQDVHDHVIGNLSDLPKFQAQFELDRPDVVVDMLAQNAACARLSTQFATALGSRYIMISSSSVYRQYGVFLGIEGGAPSTDPATEKSALRARLFPYRQALPRRPDDPQKWMDDYDKIPAEEVCRSHPGLAATIMRLPMVYGSNDPDNRVGEYVEAMRRNSEIRITETAAGWRNARGHVDNVARAIAMTVDNENTEPQIYNVADAASIPEAEWIERIAKIVGWNGRLVVVPDSDPTGIKPISEASHNPNYHQDLRLSSERIRTVLGYSEVVELEPGLQDAAGHLSP